MSNNLATLRKNHHFSRSQLADRVGVSILTLSRWERGEAVPRKYNLVKLCEVLECTEEDLAFSSQTQASGAPSSAMTPLYDAIIPLTTIELIGRETDLARIKAQLLEHTNGSVVLSALNGIPGVGKTSLAIAIVHDAEIRAAFSDGILWAPLGPTPNVPGLLHRWAGLLGLSETTFAKQDFDQRRQALRAAIGLRRMLLVFDDVWELELAFALRVGGPNCAYLTTTRFPGMANHLTRGVSLLIEELNEEQSVHLLRLLAPDVVEREETKVRQLVHAVGGLPLALTLLGHFLRKQAYNTPTRRVAAALEQMSRVDERFRISNLHVRAEAHLGIPSSVNISLDSIIAVSDQILTEAARKMFYALTIFPAKPESFSEAATLAVTDCTPNEIDELLDAGLLEYQGADRYRLHQILADYAHLHLDPQTEQQVTLRLLAYIQAYVERHAKQYELLEQEISLMLYALDLAVTHEALQVQVEPLVCTIAPFLLMRGYYQETQRFLDRAEALATASDNSVGLATILLYRGEISQKYGDFPRAKEQYLRGKELAEIANDVVLQGSMLLNIGRIYWKLGAYQEAETWLQEALALARTTEPSSLLCEIDKILAALYCDRADYATAKAHAQEGLSIARRLGDRELIAGLLINLACSLGGPPSSEKRTIYEEALGIAREIKSEELTCLALIHLANIYMENDLPQAEAHLREAGEIASRLHHREWNSIALTNLTKVLRREGRLSEAEEVIIEALILTDKMERPRFLCLALEEVGHLALARDEPESALLTFQEILRLHPEGDAEVEAMSYYGLAHTFEQLGEFEQALSFGQQALVIIQQKNILQDSEEVKRWYANFVQQSADSVVQESRVIYCFCGCGKQVKQPVKGRTRKYSSSGCRQRAYRQRKL